MLSEKPDYGDWSDQELSDELNQLDKDIDYWHKSIASQRRLLNQAMEDRETILDLVKQRGQYKGWSKRA